MKRSEQFVLVEHTAFSVSDNPELRRVLFRAAGASNSIAKMKKIVAAFRKVPRQHPQALAAERADAPVKPLTRREQHHGDVAFRSGLVLVIVGPLRCHDRPHALLLFSRRSPRPDRNHFVPHLDLHIGMG
jgi:hypothetical protein